MQRRRRGRGGPPDSTSLPHPPPQAGDSSVPEVAPTAGPRVRRARRPPTQYNVEDGEEFDINDHSDVSEEDLDAAAPGGSDHRNPHRAAVVANVTPSPTVTDPLATNRSTSNSTGTDPLATNTSSTSNKALDIEYFFRKEKDNTICKICE